MGEARTDKVSTYEARLDVGYAVCLAELHERFYRHLDVAWKVAMLFLGSAAVYGYFKTFPDISSLSALLMALLTIFDFVISPAGKIQQFNEAKRRFLELQRQASKMSAPEIVERLGILREQFAHHGIIRALREPANNQNLLQSGRPDCTVKLSAWERFVYWL